MQTNKTDSQNEPIGILKLEREWTGCIQADLVEHKNFAIYQRLEIIVTSDNKLMRKFTQKYSRSKDFISDWKPYQTKGMQQGHSIERVIRNLKKSGYVIVK